MDIQSRSELEELVRHDIECGYRSIEHAVSLLHAHASWVAEGRAEVKTNRPHGQEVGGFELAGDDHNFMPATAKIEKVGDSDTVLVSSPKIAFPRFVRYDWSGVVTTFLYNRAGLPAGTFTSE